MKELLIISLKNRELFMQLTGFCNIFLGVWEKSEWLRHAFGDRYLLTGLRHF
jgi:hypothetical protein